MSSVLIVDDNTAFATNLARLCNAAGVDADCAGSLAELRAVIDEKDYACILLDMWLGEDDGLSVLSELRQSHPEIPAVLMSGGGGAMPLETVTALADMRGLVEMLYKPFSNRQLLEVFGKVGILAKT